MAAPKNGDLLSHPVKRMRMQDSEEEQDTKNGESDVTMQSGESRT